MISLYSNYQTCRIPHIPVDFSQRICFSNTIDGITKNRKRSFLTFEKEVEIVYLGVQGDCQIFQVFIQKADYKFERRSISGKELLIKLTYIFDEIVVSTEPDGEIIKVNNFPFLKYKWGIKKTELMEEYFPPKYLHYFKYVDELLSSPVLFIKYLQRPSVYGMYFNKLRRIYKYDELQAINTDYGPDVYKGALEERIKLHIQEGNKSKLYKINIEGSENLDVKITGSCAYLDGALDHYKKELDFGTNKIIYLAKWVGLKNLFN